MNFPFKSLVQFLPLWLLHISRRKLSSMGLYRALRGSTGLHGASRGGSWKDPSGQDEASRSTALPFC